MDLPPSMSFGKIYAYTDPTDGMVTTGLTAPSGTFYNETSNEYVLPENFAAGELPFRTFVLIIALVTQILVTELTHYLFVSGRKLSLRYDFFDCYHEV